MSEDPLHIVGLSMGGTIAGLYAAEYPSVVDRVTMMCPASKSVSINADFTIKLCYLEIGGMRKIIFEITEGSR